jgi:phosphoglycerol transferase MdoB-like AlkP superfamily enzyme
MANIEGRGATVRAEPLATRSVSAPAGAKSIEGARGVLIAVVITALTLKAAAVTTAVVEGWDLLTQPTWWSPLTQAQLSSNLGFLLLLAGSLLLLPSGMAVGWLVAVDVMVSLALLADAVHVHFYGDAAAVSEIPHLRFLVSTMAAVGPGFRWSLLWYVAEWPIVFWLAAASRRQSARFSLRWRYALPIAVAGLALLGPSASRLSTVRRAMATGGAVPVAGIASIGILPYHALDLVYSGSRARAATADELEDVRSFLDEHRSSSGPSPLFGHARGRNVIIISAESLQTFVIGLSIEGRPVAPNLTRLAAESLYFSRFQDETLLGTTSDAEFSVMQGLHPIPDGVVALKYASNDFHALPHLLAANGYATLSAAAQPGGFWRMERMHLRLGFQRSLFEETFEGATRVGPWLSDGDFFDQLVPVLSSQSAPFASFLITASNHSPYRLPEFLRSFDAGPYRGTLLGRYFESVHYFDTVFGRFLERLRTSGVLDRSVLVLYGDHQAFLGESADLARLLGFESVTGRRYELWRTRKLVPLIIRLPFGASAGERESVGGHVDVPVTILSLLGLEDWGGAMLGRDLTDGQQGLAVFRDGSFAYGEYHYLIGLRTAARPVCFRARDAALVDCAMLRDAAAEATDRLRVSDLIVRHDLIPWIRGEGPVVPEPHPARGSDDAR